MDFTKLSKENLEREKKKLEEEYRSFQSKKLNLNMARGKPSPEQLKLSYPMLTAVNPESNFISSTGADCRNYGMPDGLPELRRIFAQMMGVDADNVVIGGNSSLNMMFDTVSCGMTHGFQGVNHGAARKAESSFARRRAMTAISV